MTTRANAQMTRAEKSTLIALILAQFVLFLIPLIVLGRAIGWPASLRLPAAEALPLIAGQATAVQIGYWGYMITSIALIPLTLALRRLAHRSGVESLVVDCMAAFGVAAAILKCLGIVRWLVAMPALAALYRTSDDPSVLGAIEVSYLALNGYAGAVGELLGVQLFSGLWFVLAAALIYQLGLKRTGTIAALIGTGLIATSFRTLVPGLEILQSVLPPIALLWLLLFAFVISRSRSS